VAVKHCVDITSSYNIWYRQRNLTPKYSQFINFDKDTATIDLTSMDPEFWTVEQPFTKWVHRSPDMVGKIKRLEIEGMASHWIATTWWFSAQQGNLKSILGSFTALEKVNLVLDFEGLWHRSLYSDTERRNKKRDYGRQIGRRWNAYFKDMPSKPRYKVHLKG
jgi:hypothetical protein